MKLATHSQAQREISVVSDYDSFTFHRGFEFLLKRILKTSNDKDRVLRFFFSKNK